MDEMNNSSKSGGASSNKREDERLFREAGTDRETTASSAKQAGGGGWKVLVADDEEDVHSVTNLALKGFSYKGKGIRFLNARSGSEARKLLKKHPDTAVVLLDVVMESGTTGLDLVRYIREELGYAFCQVVLRTGHPGYAPEREVVLSYDINDYRTKTELTAFKLFTLMYASLRAYDALTSLDKLRRGLEEKVVERTADIERQKETILEMDRMKTRFFANISHELRTPLTLLLGPLEDMLVGEHLTEKKRRNLEMMHRSALKLLGMVNQLLGLAKLDAGTMKLELSESDLFRFLRMVVSDFISLAERRKIRFEQAIPDGEHRAWFDAGKLEQVLVNLLSNAFKFTPEGGRVTFMARLASAQDEGVVQNLEVTVGDSGPGIPAGKEEKIFDRFYRIENGDGPDRDGSGIGLSLTKEIIDLNHGSIRVETQPEKGSRFTVIFPLGRSHLDDSEYRIRAPEEEENAMEQNMAVRFLPDPGPGEVGTVGEDMEGDDERPLILVVEDNADLRKHLKDHLAGRYRVEVCRDGASGLSQAFGTIPDLVISDLMMPGLNGLELCGRLKSDERTSHIPVILLTARASSESRIEGLETGADDYLTKPFDMQELLVRAENLVKRQNLLREKYEKGYVLGDREFKVTPADERFITRIVSLAEEHMRDNQFDVNRLSDLAGLSRMQLFRKLKGLTGQSPSEFIRTLRLRKAAALIRGNFGNLSEITYEVGFNNPSYFGKSFRELYGMSPSEYANKEQE